MFRAKFHLAFTNLCAKKAAPNSPQVGTKTRKEISPTQVNSNILFHATRPHARTLLFSYPLLNNENWKIFSPPVRKANTSLLMFGGICCPFRIAKWRLEMKARNKNVIDFENRLFPSLVCFSSVFLLISQTNYLLEQERCCFVFFSTEISTEGRWMENMSFSAYCFCG